MSRWVTPYLQRAPFWNDVTCMTSREVITVVITVRYPYFLVGIGHSGSMPVVYPEKV